MRTINRGSDQSDSADRLPVGNGGESKLQRRLATSIVSIVIDTVPYGTGRIGSVSREHDNLRTIARAHSALRRYAENSVVAVCSIPVRDGPVRLVNRGRRWNKKQKLFSAKERTQVMEFVECCPYSARVQRRQYRGFAMGVVNCVTR